MLNPISSNSPNSQEHYEQYLQTKAKLHRKIQETKKKLQEKPEDSELLFMLHQLQDTLQEAEYHKMIREYRDSHV